jgi:hypothetical protein
MPIVDRDAANFGANESISNGNDEFHDTVTIRFSKNFIRSKTSRVVPSGFVLQAEKVWRRR